MIDTNALRKKVLDLAIRGKLVPQNPNDEPASILLERIREEKQRLIREGKIKKDKVDSIIFRGEDNCHYEKVGETVKKIELELPEGWQFCRLSLVCWLNNGEKTSGEKLPYLDARTLRGKNEKTFLDNGIIVNEGEKVILVDGENSGEVFIVPYRGYMGSTFKILQMVSLINVEFIKIILDYYKDILKESKTGAAIPHLNKQLLKSIIIGVPPIEEQYRIVNQVQSIMLYIDLLESNQNDYADLVESLKKAILQSAIQGTLVEQDDNDEPASELLARIRAEKKTHLGKKYVESYIYKSDDNRYYEKNGTETQDITEILPLSIPQSWVWCKIRDLAFVTKLAGFEYTKYIADNLTDTGIPLFKGKNIQNSEIIYEFESWIPETISNELIRSQINKKCILTPYVGTIGNIGIHNREGKFHLGSNVGKIELYPYNVIIEEYLVHYLKSCYGYKELTKYKKATCQDSISIDAIREVYVPIPPLSEQYRIVEKIDFLFSMLKDED